MKNAKARMFSRLRDGQMSMKDMYVHINSILICYFNYHWAARHKFAPTGLTDNGQHSADTVGKHMP
jgi:hypothetical protein